MTQRDLHRADAIQADERHPCRMHLCKNIVGTILLVFPISFPANIPERVSVNCGPTAIVHHPEKEPKIRRTIGNKSKPDQMHQNRSKMSGPRPDKSFLELQHCEILLLLGHETIRFDDLRRPCQKPLHAWSTLVCNPHREIYIYN